MENEYTNPIIKDFILYLQNTLKRSKHTVRAYQKDVEALDSYLHLYDLNMESATIHHLRGWLANGARAVNNSNNKPLKSSTVKRRIAALRVFFKWMVDQQYRSDNPCTRIKPPKTTEHLPRHLSHNEVERLVEHPAQEGWFKIRNRAILELLYGAGIRAAETEQLNVGDIDLDNFFVRVIGKGNKERKVPFGEPAADALKQWIKITGTEGPLFRNKFGNRLSSRSIWTICRNSGRLNGISELHPHVLRHTCATHLIGGRMDLRSIQRQLGHSSINTTQRYIHVDIERMRTAHKIGHPLSKHYKK